MAAFRLHSNLSSDRHPKAYKTEILHYLLFEGKRLSTPITDWMVCEIHTRKHCLENLSTGGFLKVT